MTSFIDTNIVPRHPLGVLAAALAISLGATSSAGAVNLACKPKVIATNNKGASIKVLAFRYTVAGTEYTEALDNKRLAVGETEEWNSVNLQHAASGIRITSTRLEMKNDNSGDGDGYGPMVLSPSINRPYICTDGHTYPHDIR